MNCSDMLEMDPENSVTFENGLESELDLESTLNSIQYNIRQNLGVGQWGMIVRGIMCDTTEAVVARNFEYSYAPKQSCLIPVRITIEGQPTFIKHLHTWN